MDRNAVVGLVLIGALMLIYFGFVAEPPQKPEEPKTDTTQVAQNNTTEVRTDTDTIEDTVPDSVRRKMQEAAFGPFASAMEGENIDLNVENDLLNLVFSSKGAFLKSAVLKDFTDYDGNRLKLIKKGSLETEMQITTASGYIDLRKLFYKFKIEENEDSKTIIATADLGNNQSVVHKYTIANNSYTIDYSVNFNNLGNLINQQEPLIYRWKQKALRLEKELQQSKRRTAVNYYTLEKDLDNVGNNSEGYEEEAVNQPMKWVAFKQKFFSIGLIAENKITEANVFAASNEDEKDSSFVKTLGAIVHVPLNNNGVNLKYFIGPNDTKIQKNVAPGFEENVYLGWTIFATINKYTIVPLFNFLESFISNYGIIIIILVFIIKLILSPLSYKSYLSMAKMRVLKPQMDAIKEQYGDDMQGVQQANMQLFQKVGVNPLSGCIPVLLQMPVFLSLFNFFPNSIDLRQKSFLWADDLSSYDSVMKLPFEIPFYGDHVSLFTLLMTLSTLAYTYYNQQLNSGASAATGPQANMKYITYIMPFFMLFFLNSFASALTLYYFVSNLITIGQQFAIKSFIDEDKVKAKLDEIAKQGGPKKNRLQRKLEESMKQQEQTQQNRASRRQQNKKK